MDCCYEEPSEYSVPPLVMPSNPARRCPDPSTCYPCLPGCDKPARSCEKPPPHYHHAPRAATNQPPCCDQHSYPQGPAYGYKTPAPQCGGGPQYASPRPPPQYFHQTPPPPRGQCAVHGAPQAPQSCCAPVRTKYVMPCYRYEDGRIVSKLPVSAFKRNGMQDQDISSLGTPNFLKREPRDVEVEYDVCRAPIKVCDPTRIKRCETKPLGDRLMQKKPIVVKLEDSNQPTTLMKRACEVAVGVRPRKSDCGPYSEPEPGMTKYFAAHRAEMDKGKVSRCAMRDEECCYYYAKEDLPQVAGGDYQVRRSKCSYRRGCPNPPAYEDAVIARTINPKYCLHICPLCLQDKDY